MRFSPCTRWMLSAALALAGWTACAAEPTAAAPFVAPELPSGWTPKRIAYANQDMVSAANPLAVQAGVTLLAQGGSAVDAAIAVQMVLNLVEPQSSGLGGGAFLLHYDQPRRQLLAYDGRETAPADATADMFIGPDQRPLGLLAAVDGGLSVGTPGLLRMLEAAHKAHGKLPWADLFAPAIRLAQDGFEISDRLHTSVAGAAERIKAQGEPIASYFLNQDGTAKARGTRLQNPQLAATLQTIATQGADAFYSGEIAQDMVAKVRAHPTRPGRLSLADLQGYKSLVREPVCAVYRGAYRVCGMPPPSSGGITLLQTLGLLENFDLSATAPNSADAVHLISEAYRLAYADRDHYLADPDFVNVPQAGLLASGYLRQRASLIRLHQSMGTPKPGVPAGSKQPLGADTSGNLPSTSHVSIVDRHGQAVSMTSTIENGFGSLQMVRGFLLNNQLTDFSFTAQDPDGRWIANRVEPLKRPRSSMAPIVVLHARSGDLEAVIGSPGGSAIIQYVTKSLIGMMDWQLDVQEAINLPNFGAQTSPVTVIEAGSSLDTPAIRADLRARGHTVVPTSALVSGLHGLVYNGKRPDGSTGLFGRQPALGAYAGGADPRREGVAAGND
jgi:gamma-glutamyltranspeptidase / glutathione hydrolase